ncbi:STM4015 family protein [Micromonospora echinofusca]|uniref:Leucine-rich repeat domain-containing protein n=1 Tax=Micromonospora echinofusca TaxID=47858 RepID=A0ABS3VWA9_MICEH|nr:STM4015 family protein [Micromonospora echinofusca]MBO4208751.1 leucine-rich repeat domain-containing protein [Micromonospora echinofusca]
MPVNTHLSMFAGLPVHRFVPGDGLPDDPSAVAWRLEVDDFDAPPEEFAELFAAFLEQVPAHTVRAVVVGEWGSAYEQPPPVGLLAGAARRLTALRALFLADLVGEQCEISWINQDDVTPLLTAYPHLEVLRVRGAQDLRLAPVRHGGLRELAVESGGLPGTVVRAVGGCDLPALTHLELWLGVPDYGCDTTVDDLAGILDGRGLPALRHLGLRNAAIADPVAAAVATAPVVPRLAVLDLSMGMLTDDGAAALLAGQPLTHLERLDLHHHFLSPERARQLTGRLPGVDVDLSGAREPRSYQGRSYRYTAVAE